MTTFQETTTETSEYGVLAPTPDGRWSLKVRVDGRLTRCRGYWPTCEAARTALDVFAALSRSGQVAPVPVGEGARADNNAGSIQTLNGDPGKWSVRMRVRGRLVRCRGYWPTQEAAAQALHDWQVLVRNGYQSEDAPLVGPKGVRGAAPFSPASLAPVGTDGTPDRSRTLVRDVYRAFVDTHTEGGFAAMSRDRRAFWGVLTGTSKGRAGNASARLVLGDLAIGDLTWGTIQQWANSLKEPDTSKPEGDPRRVVSPSTRAKWGRHLKQLLAWSVPEYVPVSPWPQGKKVVQPQVVKKTIKRRFFMSPDEMWRIADAAGDERLLFLTMMFSGLRQGEVRALTPACLAGGLVPELVVVHAVDSYKGPARLATVKTDGSERRVAIPRDLMRDLRKHVEDNKIAPDAPLFPAPKGGRNGSAWMRHEWLNRRWNEAVAAAGVERTGNLPPNQRRTPTPHDARATAASMLQYAGVMPVECQQWLGHEDVTMTLTVYTQAATWASRHPLLLGLRRKGFSLAEAIDWLYVATHAWHVTAIGGGQDFDSAERFGPGSWRDDSDRRSDVAQEVMDIYRASRYQPAEAETRPIPVRVPVLPAQRADSLAVPADEWAGYDPAEDQPDD